MQQIRKVETANMAEVVFDGKVFGMCQNVSSQANISLDPVSGIGDPRIIENVPTQFMYSWSCEAILLKTNGLSSILGQALSIGLNALQGWVFDLVVRSTDSNRELFHLVSCSIESDSVQVASHRTISISVQGKALDRTALV